jgi:hypothetical protein
VLHRESYPVVKKGHIVPACYQRSFAIQGRVAVHPEGKEDCFKLAVENAAREGPSTVASATTAPTSTISKRRSRHLRIVARRCWLRWRVARPSLTQSPG